MNSNELKILERFLSGKSSEKEKSFVSNLFADGERNEELKSFVKDDFDEFLTKDDELEVNLEHVLGRVHHILHVSKQAQQRLLRRRKVRLYSYAAAVLLPIIFISGVWIGRLNRGVEGAASITQIHSPMGARVQFSLPDGTSGWLNSGSTLKYSIPFGNNRDVQLNGEAYFDVAHDVTHPFSVLMDQAKITVLGTKFNACSYTEENFTEVVLEEGKVEFSLPDGKTKVTMKPSEMLRYNKDGIKQLVVDPYKFSAWKDGKLIFKGDPMKEVVSRLERWYNVHIDVLDESLYSYSFRATFEDDSIEDVLYYISMTSPIEYKIDKRGTKPDGTLSKLRISLKKRN